MIRRATVSDIPKLLEMARKFSEKAGLEDNVGYDPHSTAQTFEAMIKDGHPLFLSDTGFIGATQMRHPFNHEHIAAHELFWWSEGRDGLKLLDALIRHCEEHCHSLTMVTLESIRPEATGKLYRRLGFAPLEHSYVKGF